MILGISLGETNAFNNNDDNIIMIIIIIIIIKKMEVGA